MAKPRTFKVTPKLMEGDDVADFQRFMRDEFDGMNIDYPITVDGRFGVGTRSACATLCVARGMIHSRVMKEGVTPYLRQRLRNRDFTDAEKARASSKEGVDYRRALREKFEAGGVCSPLVKIFTHANGWTGPRGHDGVDLICPKDAPGFAICKAKVIRADNGGWWGKSPSGDVSKGDGITIIRSLVNVGPIKEGMNFGYGHAEANKVRVGQVVEAGDIINKAGTAVVPHFHFMVNVGMGDSGRGDRDPWPFVKYAIDHS